MASNDGSVSAYARPHPSLRFEFFGLFSPEAKNLHNSAFLSGITYERERTTCGPHVEAPQARLDTDRPTSHDRSAGIAQAELADTRGAISAIRANLN